MKKMMLITMFIVSAISFTDPLENNKYKALEQKYNNANKVVADMEEGYRTRGSVYANQKEQVSQETNSAKSNNLFNNYEKLSTGYNARYKDFSNAMKYNSGNEFYKSYSKDLEGKFESRFGTLDMKDVSVTKEKGSSYSLPGSSSDSSSGTGGSNSTNKNGFTSTRAVASDNLYNTYTENNISTKRTTSTDTSMSQTGGIFSNASNENATLYLEESKSSKYKRNNEFVANAGIATISKSKVMNTSFSDNEKLQGYYQKQQQDAMKKTQNKTQKNDNIGTKILNYGKKILTGDLFGIAEDTATDTGLIK